MNDISKKNEKFVSDGLQLLSTVEDIKGCELAIDQMISQYGDGVSIVMDKIFREFEKADYLKTKTDDIVSSIVMHSSKVEYEYDDVLPVSTSTKKNAHIYNPTLGRYLPVTQYIPDFNITLINTGFSGIDKGDVIDIEVYNDASDIKTSKSYSVGFDINELGGYREMTISRLPCPQVAYIYNIKIDLKNQGSVYSTYTIKNVTIGEGASNAI